MRVSMLFVLLILTAAAWAQTGGDYLGQMSPPPKVSPEFAPGAIGYPARPDKAVNKPTNEALDRTLGKVSLDNMPLSQTIEQWAKDAHVDVVVHWKEVEAAGVTRSRPVTLELSQVPARQALRVILEEAGGDKGGAASLRFIVDENRVVISTTDDLQSAKYRVVLVYDLRPLFADWEYDSQEALNGAKYFVDTVEAVIDPDSWRETGGVVGSARILNGQLIVNQTLENHDAIAAFLQEWAAGAGQVTRAYDVGDLVKDDAKSQVPALIAAIEANCGRDTWRDQGGRSSTIAYFKDKLFITTRAAIHDQIADLLKLMRQK